MAAPVKYGESIFYNEQQVQDAQKATTHIDVRSLFYQVWTYLKELRKDPTQQGSPLERDGAGVLHMKDLSGFHESLKSCGAMAHHLELISAIFTKVIEKPPNPAKDCNLFDILFLCLNDRFNAPRLESFIDFSAYPTAEFKRLIELPLFGINETTGEVIAHPHAPEQLTEATDEAEATVNAEATSKVRNPIGVFQRRKGLAAMMNFLQTRAKNEEAKANLPPGSAPPSALSVSKDQNVREAIKKWESQHYKLTKSDLGSNKFIGELLEMKSTGVFDTIHLTKCGSQKKIERDSKTVIRSGATMEATVEWKLGANGAGGSAMTSKIKPGPLDGVISINTREEFLSALNVYFHGLAIAEIVSIDESRAYFHLLKEHLETYPQNWYELFLADFLIRQDFEQLKSAIKTYPALYQEYSEPSHPRWEALFLSVIRNAPMQQLQAALSSTWNLPYQQSKPVGTKGAQQQGAAWAQKPAGLGAAQGQAAWYGAPTGQIIPQARKPGALVDDTLTPHGRPTQWGCGDFHLGGACTCDTPNEFYDPIGPCGKSHVCPLISCGGAIHSWKRTHGDELTWGGRPKVVPRAAPYQSQSKGKAKDGKDKGKGKPKGKDKGKGKAKGAQKGKGKW
jgi:hypothetical protein